MKVKNNISLFVSGFLSAQVIFNYSRKFKYSNITPGEDTFEYEWRYGKIKYIERGTGKPLLILHDLCPGSSLSDLEEEINLLAKKRKVYAFDFTGYGCSDKPKLSYSSYLLITLINDFLKDVSGCTDVIAYGHTAGLAILASEFSPRLFKKIFLRNPKNIRDSHTYPTDRDLIVRNLLLLPVFGEFMYNIITLKPVMKYLHHTPERLVKGRAIVAHQNTKGACYAMAAFYSGLLKANVSLSLRGKPNICVLKDIDKIK